MGLLNRLLGTNADVKARTAAAPSRRNPPANGDEHSARKDLLRLVEREVLNRKGIPQAWLSTETLRTTTARQQQGIHLRFLVRTWEPRLLLHGPALEQEFMQRLLMMDPQARNWIMGFSWQFALQDTSACPPLPHPGAWTNPADAQGDPPTRAKVQGDPPSRNDAAAGIIAGPVVLPKQAVDVRANLERLLSLRSDDRRFRSDDFAPTQPPAL